MLPPDIINNIRNAIQVGLKAGAYDFVQLGSLARVAGALDMEEKLWQERQAQIEAAKKAAPPPPDKPE